MVFLTLWLKARHLICCAQMLKHPLLRALRLYAHSLNQLFANL
jgi:hypothetical protein